MNILFLYIIGSLLAIILTILTIFCLHIFKVFFIYAGGFLAITLTILFLHIFNVFSRPSFEPFFSPWSWVGIYSFLNATQVSFFLLILLGIIRGCNLNLPISLYQWFEIGFIFSLLYILGSIFILDKFEVLKNPLIGFIIYPSLLFIIILGFNILIVRK